MLYSGCFPKLVVTATMTLSKIFKARFTISMCPYVIGSNVLGYTARDWVLGIKETSVRVQN